MRKKVILTMMFILLLFTRIIGADSKNSFVIELDTEKFTESSIEKFIDENNYDELVSKNNELIELAIKNIVIYIIKRLMEKSISLFVLSTQKNRNMHTHIAVSFKTYFQTAR